MCCSCEPLLSKAHTCSRFPRRIPNPTLFLESTYSFLGSDEPPVCTAMLVLVAFVGCAEWCAMLDANCPLPTHSRCPRNCTSPHARIFAGSAASTAMFINHRCVVTRSRPCARPSDGTPRAHTELQWSIGADLRHDSHACTVSPRTASLCFDCNHSLQRRRSYWSWLILVRDTCVRVNACLTRS